MKGRSMPALIFGCESQYLQSPLSTTTHIFNIFFLSFRQEKIESGHTVSSYSQKTWSTVIMGCLELVLLITEFPNTPESLLSKTLIAGNQFLLATTQAAPISSTPFSHTSYFQVATVFRKSLPHRRRYPSFASIVPCLAMGDPLLLSTGIFNKTDSH